MADEASTVLENDFRVYVAFNDKVQLSSARVNMRGIEATRTEESNGDGTALTDKRWEGVVVRSCNVSTLALGDTLSEGGIVELEEVLVIGKEFGALDRVGR